MCDQVAQRKLFTLAHYQDVYISKDMLRLIVTFFSGVGFDLTPK